MNKKSLIYLLIATSFSVISAPILQMNRAFDALSDLMPYLLDEPKFSNKNNEKNISKSLHELEKAFTLAGHDDLIRHDLFAPSYQLLIENLKNSKKAFQEGKKEYAFWMVHEAASTCLDCHTRLPIEHASSFQNGELNINLTKIKSSYEKGINYLIIRRYVDAKESFVRDIQDKFITKNMTDMILSFQQILLIETKIMKDPSRMISLIDSYQVKKNLPDMVSKELATWKNRLIDWKDEKYLKTGLTSEKDLIDFKTRRLLPLKQKSFEDAYKVDLLLASGLLSNYFFQTQNSPSAPELTYWIGWIEKRLKKEDFLSSGELFLKQCIKKYPKSLIAQECYSEYKESMEFNFTGSSGTHIPNEIVKELNELKSLMTKPVIKK